MRNQGKQIQAMTLTELLVVMAVMVIMLAIAAPVAKKLAQTLGESTGARSVIAAAMSNARAIAVRDQKYAGVRFQQDSSGKQYLILIINDPNATGLANGFRAIQGKKPMALPDDVGVIADGTYSDTTTVIALNTPAGMTHATTFTVLFSPAGKYVTHLARVRNKDKKAEPDNTSNDNIFNTQTNVSNGKAMFKQDDYSPELYEENSVSSFVIYSKKELDKVDTAKRWSGYLSKLDKDFINPYTGELIKKN
jgi:prepilin-type N-terminal cleavage/methylation domain-containing protein